MWFDADCKGVTPCELFMFLLLEPALELTSLSGVRTIGGISVYVKAGR